MAEHPGEHEPLIGWCSEHECVAEVYNDGSIGCMYLTVIEQSRDDCQVVPVPPEYLLTADYSGSYQPLEDQP